MTLPATGVRITARADRIDIGPDAASIYDLKTGKPPSRKETETFAKQVLIEAIMLARGGFDDLPAQTVAEAAYIGLGPPYEETRLDVSSHLLERIALELDDLLRHYSDPASGYAARLRPKWIKYASDFDGISRYGEWDDTDTARTIEVGR